MFARLTHTHHVCDSHEALCTRSNSRWPHWYLDGVMVEVNADGLAEVGHHLVPGADLHHVLDDLGGAVGRLEDTEGHGEVELEDRSGARGRGSSPGTNCCS